MKRITLLIISLLLIGSISAQDSLKNGSKAQLKIKIAEANEAYNIGDMDNSIELLQSITDNHLLMTAATRQQKAEIMRLGAITSLYSKDLQQADEYIKEILKYQPDYKLENINNTDLASIKIKLNDLYARPKWSVGLALSTNMSLISAGDTYELMDYNDANEREYSSTLGAVSYFANAEYTLTPRLSVVGGLGYSTNSYAYTLPLMADHKKSIQTLDYLLIPLSLRFHILPERTLCPYVQGGVAAKYLVSAERSVGATKTTMDDLYEKFDYGIQAGAGLKFHFNSYIILSADLLYYNGLQNINKTKNRFIAGPPGEEFLFRYYDVMDDIKLNNLSLSVRLSYALNHEVFSKKRVARVKNE